MKSLPIFKEGRRRNDFVAGFVLSLLLSMGVVGAARAGVNEWTNIGPEVKIESLAISPETPEIVYAGGDGLFISTNAGSSWTELKSLPPGDAFRAIAIDPQNASTVFAGVYGDNGALYRSTDSGESWEVVLDDVNINAIVIDPQATDALHSAALEGVFKTENAGATWMHVMTDETLAVAIDVVRPSNLYALVGSNWLPRNTRAGGAIISLPAHEVFKTTDGGLSWQATGLSRPILSALAVDPFPPNAVYVGGGLPGATGGVLKSTDAGATWMELGPDGPVVALVTDRHTPGTLYAGGYGEIWKSVDAGANWNSLGHGPAGLIYCLTVDPSKPNVVYAGTDEGVFRMEQDCVGDCNGDGKVQIHELLTSVGTGLGVNFLSECPACDADGDGEVGVHELVTAVRNGLFSCWVECGNGVARGREDCDDANDDPSDGCTNSCTICGNGVVTWPEECDDGNDDPTDGCTNACTACGNASTTWPEECDDGNSGFCDGCSATCRIEINPVGCPWRVFDDADAGGFLNFLVGSELTTIDFEDVAVGGITGDEYLSRGIRFASLAPEHLNIAPPYSYLPNMYYPSNFLSVGAVPGVGGDSLNDSLAVDIPDGTIAIGWTFFDTEEQRDLDESIAFYDETGQVIYSQPYIPGSKTPQMTSFFGIVSEEPVFRIEVIEAPDDVDDVGYDDFIFAFEAGG